MRSSLFAQLSASVRILAIMTVAVGVVYPLTMTAVAQVAFEDRANGSLVRVDGDTIGSRLIAQPFTTAEYFHPRPSAADFEASTSTGSNLGPTNPTLLETVSERVEEYRQLNGLDPDAAVPVDAVTASASGLDPHISPANARFQAERVADARGIELAAVLDLVDEHTERRPLGVLGDDAVNVLALNVALDELTVRP